MIKAYESARPTAMERYLLSYHPCIQEIQATIAYVHMNGCDTQVMVSDPAGVRSFRCTCPSLRSDGPELTCLADP